MDFFFYHDAAEQHARSFPTFPRDLSRPLLDPPLQHSIYLDYNKCMHHPPAITNTISFSRDVTSLSPIVHHPSLTSHIILNITTANACVLTASKRGLQSKANIPTRTRFTPQTQAKT
ncbi:hypothetical protein ACN47E_002498 [Coniothyrium glycines]